MSGKLEVLDGYFEVKCCLRQGCVKLPWLFNVFVDKRVKDE